MDFVVKKIQELDLTRNSLEGHCNSRGSTKYDSAMNLSDHKKATGRGCESHPDCLRIQPKATGRGEDCCFVPQYYTVLQRFLCGAVDPIFIQSVTVTELVCGARRYKCLGCLRYHDHLGGLLEHINQGWREGFSCKAFYRQLKGMCDRELIMGNGSQVGNQLSRSSASQLRSTPLAPTTTP